MRILPCYDQVQQISEALVKNGSKFVRDKHT